MVDAMLRNPNVLINLLSVYHSNKNLRPSEWIYLQDICDNLVCYMFDQAIILLSNWLDAVDENGNSKKNSIEKLRFYEFDSSIKQSDDYNKTFAEIVSEME